MSVYNIITSQLRLLNVVCVTSKPKLIGGAYKYIYIHVQTQHFLNNIHDSIIRYIERKKTVQTCLRWSKKCADWLLIFISSYFFLFMYVYSDTKMLVTGFSFFLFFISVCELNKMLVRYIFYCWEFSLTLLGFLHKMANTKMSWFLYNHTNVLTQTIVCVF